MKFKITKCYGCRLNTTHAIYGRDYPFYYYDSLFLNVYTRAKNIYKHFIIQNVLTKTNDFNEEGEKQ